MAVRAALLIIFAVLLCPSADATTWYVDSANGNDANSCATAQSSGASAKATILAGVNCVGDAGTTDGAGDTVSVAPGSYQEGLYRELPSGTVGNPFILLCSSSRNCEWDTGTCNLEKCHFEVNSLDGFDYAEIRGFHFYSADSDECGVGVDLNGDTDNVSEFESVLFEDNEFGPCTDGFPFYFAGVNTIVRDSYFHDIGEVCTGLGQGYCHAIYNGGTNLLIEDSEFANIWGYSIHIYTLSHSTTLNIVIRRNYIHDSQGSNDGSAILVDGTAAAIYANVMVNTAGCVNLFDGAEQTKVYQNTCVDSQSYGVQIVNNGGNDDNDIRNNIIFGQAGNAINDLCGGSCTGTITSPNTTDDPDFITAGNYHLQSTSVARDAGDDLNAVVATDYDGVSLDDTPDNGALQHVSAGSLTSAPIHVYPRVLR